MNEIPQAGCCTAQGAEQPAGTAQTVVASDGPEARVRPEATAKAGEITALDEELTLMGKALGHPARLAIVRHLAQVRGCVCGRIVKVLPLAQSTVSQHLKILKQSGLVQGRVEGPRTCYCLDLEKLARFEALLAGLANPHGDEDGHA